MLAAKLNSSCAVRRVPRISRSLSKRFATLAIWTAGASLVTLSFKKFMLWLACCSSNLPIGWRLDW